MWINRLRSLFATPKASRPRARRRPILESLEVRDVPAILVVDPGSHGPVGQMIELDGVTGHQRVETIGYQFNNLIAPRGIAVAPAGDIYVADVGRDAVIRIDPVTEEQTFLGQGGDLVDASAVAFASNGDLFVATTGG